MLWVTQHILGENRKVVFVLKNRENLDEAKVCEQPNHHLPAFAQVPRCNPDTAFVPRSFQSNKIAVRVGTSTQVWADDRREGGLRLFVSK